MVTVLARSLLDSGVWYRIETPEGKTGWVHASEITLLETEWGVSGEFIAADPDTLFVLAGRRLVAAPLHRIASVIVDAYEPQTGDLEAWTAIGALSTISHGYYLSLTLPLWILVGVSTTATENQAPITRFDDEVTIDDLRIFTRFPQGLPPNIDRSSLKPKPTPKE